MVNKSRQIKGILWTWDSRSFSFWEWTSCIFCACPSELAERFSTSVNSRSLSRCAHQIGEDEKLYIKKNIVLSSLNYSFLVSDLHSPFFLLKFQYFLSKVLLKGCGVISSNKSHLRLPTCRYIRHMNLLLSKSIQS